jgi:serine protease Do
LPGDLHVKKSPRIGMLARASACAVACVLLPGPATADTVVLKSGAKLEGTVVKRTDRRVWLDIGPDILALDVDEIEEVTVDDAGVPTTFVEETLYSTAENLAELSPKEHAKRLGPAVIKVSTPGGLGSGVIISRAGHAITNAHVIQGETNIKTTVWFPQPDGTLKRVVIEDIEILAVNSHLDLALIRIEHPDGDEFLFAPLEHDQKLEIGQPVFAIGNPLGLERTLTQGVVSTTLRNFDGLTYVQTDTPINPGNSGGPLFNSRGEVIGITNMGILGGEALGFAIPARYVKDFIRNREAFGYDKDNPNSGHNYHRPPPRRVFDVAPQLRDGTGTP